LSHCIYCFTTLASTVDATIDYDHDHECRVQSNIRWCTDPNSRSPSRERHMQVDASLDQYKYPPTWYKYLPSHPVSLLMFMLIDLLHIFHNLQDERTTHPRDQSFSLYKRIPTSLQYPPSFGIRDPRSDLWHSLAIILIWSEGGGRTLSKAGSITPSSIALPSTSGTGSSVSPCVSGPGANCC
jgi:hypothetical protein